MDAIGTDTLKRKRGRPAHKSRKDSVIHVKVHKDLKNRLDDAAARDRRSLAESVAIAIEDWLRVKGL